jgi:ribosome biogenesis protein NSA1
VLEKVYMKSVPTCVVWDGVTDEDAANGDGDDDEIRRGSGGSDDDGGDDDDENVWEAMPAVEDSEDESETQARRRRAGRK